MRDAQWSYDAPNELIAFPEEFRSGHCRWWRSVSDGGDCGEEGGETELEGERVVCIKYAILYLSTQWPGKKISRRRVRAGESSPNMENNRSIT